MREKSQEKGEYCYCPVFDEAVTDRSSADSSSQGTGEKAGRTQMQAGSV